MNFKFKILNIVGFILAMVGFVGMFSTMEHCRINSPSCYAFTGLFVVCLVAWAVFDFETTNK